MDKKAFLAIIGGLVVIPVSLYLSLCFVRLIIWDFKFIYNLVVTSGVSDVNGGAGFLTSILFFFQLGITCILLFLGASFIDYLLGSKKK